jgi:hypothetical protein
MLPLAHIAGVPVEETLGMFVPVATVIVGVCAATVKIRWRELRAIRRAHRPARSRGGSRHAR